MPRLAGPGGQPAVDVLGPRRPGAGDWSPGPGRELWPGPGEARQLPVLSGEGGAQARGSRVPSMAAWATSVRRRLWLRA